MDKNYLRREVANLYGISPNEVTFGLIREHRRRRMGLDSCDDSFTWDEIELANKELRDLASKSSGQYSDNH